MSAVSRRIKWQPSPPPPASPKILHFHRRRRTHRRKQTKSQSYNPQQLMNQNFLSYLESQFCEENNESHGLQLELSNSSVEMRGRVEEEEEAEKWRFEAEMLGEECSLLRMERELALEKKRVKMEKTLQSGRKKIEEGTNGDAVLEEEIEDLAERIQELQNSSRLNESQVGNCSIKKSGITYESNSKSTENGEGRCTGQCKAMVQRILEQVRAETEQWSQIQKMLDRVRRDMEELQASRDYWERQAHYSDCESQSLRLAVEAWKERALHYEEQVKDLELKGKKPHDIFADVPKSYHMEENKKMTAPLSLAKRLAKEKGSLIRSLKGNRRDKELSEDGAMATRRLPLRDIANSSLLERHNHRIAFHYHSPESSRIRESFRK